MLKIHLNNYLYHLSYDLKSPSEVEDDRNNDHLNFKRDLVWEIIISSDLGLHLSSPVASTVIFESSKDFNFWIGKLNNFADRIYFVLSEVNTKLEISEQSIKEMSIILSPNDTLNAKFQTDVVDYEIDNYNRINKSGRKPSTRL